MGDIIHHHVPHSLFAQRLGILFIISLGKILVFILPVGRFSTVLVKVPKYSFINHIDIQVHGSNRANLQFDSV